MVNLKNKTLERPFFALETEVQMARVILIISSSIGAIGTEIIEQYLLFTEYNPFCDFLSLSK